MKKLLYILVIGLCLGISSCSDDSAYKNTHEVFSNEIVVSGIDGRYNNMTGRTDYIVRYSSDSSCKDTIFVYEFSMDGNVSCPIHVGDIIKLRELPSENSIDVNVVIK